MVFSGTLYQFLEAFDSKFLQVGEIINIHINLFSDDVFQFKDVISEPGILDKQEDGKAEDFFCRNGESVIKES